MRVFNSLFLEESDLSACHYLSQDGTSTVAQVYTRLILRDLSGRGRPVLLGKTWSMPKRFWRSGEAYVPHLFLFR